jgi:hypothetical protein
MSAFAAYLDSVKPRLRTLVHGQAHVCSLTGSAALCLVCANTLSGEVQR